MTGHTQARDWLAAELRRHGLAPAAAAAVLGGADTYAARASAHAVAAEREQHMPLTAELPPRGPDGFRDITCGLCGETFGTNFHDDEIQCADCEARRCPDCGSWFGAEADR